MITARWLIVAASLIAPTMASAQPKPASADPAPAAPTTPSPQQPASADDPPSADDPAGKPGTPGSPGALPGATPDPAAKPGGEIDICQITPDAPQCQASAKPIDLGTEAKKGVNAEIYAMPQIYALRYHRFEVQPYWSFSLNDQFVSHPGPGLGLNYYLTNVLAVGLNGNWYGGLNVDSDFNFQNRRATRVATPLNEYQWLANLNFTYVPMYGKFSGFRKFIFHYDAYVVGGLGLISTRPVAVIDPDNRNFKFEPKLNVGVGIGFRIFLNRWFAANFEVRDYIFPEQLEAVTVKPGTRGAGSAADPNTWNGETQLTNNVQAQLGVSVFLPFSWEYRLPK